MSARSRRYRHLTEGVTSRRTAAHAIHRVSPPPTTTTWRPSTSRLEANSGTSSPRPWRLAAEVVECGDDAGEARAGAADVARFVDAAAIIPQCGEREPGEGQVAVDLEPRWKVMPDSSSSFQRRMMLSSLKPGMP